MRRNLKTSNGIHCSEINALCIVCTSFVERRTLKQSVSQYSLLDDSQRGGRVYFNFPSLWVSNQIRKGLICHARVPPSLHWFDLKSPLTHHSLSSLGAMWPWWCGLSYHAVWIPWASSSGSGDSNHSVLQIKEKEAKRRVRRTLSWRVWTLHSHHFPILVKAMQAPLIFTNASVQSPVPSQPQAPEPLLISQGSRGSLLTLLSRN